jgi:hypothetical protein
MNQNKKMNMFTNIWLIGTTILGSIIFYPSMSSIILIMCEIILLSMCELIICTIGSLLILILIGLCFEFLKKLNQLIFQSMKENIF